MLIVTRSTISAVQLQSNRTVLFIDMMPGTAKHIRVSALEWSERKMTGLFTESETVHEQTAIFPLTGAVCVLSRYSESVLEIEVAGKDPMYYELGKPVLNLLADTLPALAYNRDPYELTHQRSSS